MAQELAAPGELRQSATFDFEFKNVEKQYESYFGINVKLRYVYPPRRIRNDGKIDTFIHMRRCRYLVRVTVARRMGSIIKEKDIWVYSYRMPPESNTSIKMEVGIEDCLHIEFEYNKNK